jgi:hypothetical protein
MTRLVFLLEERSMQPLLEGLLPQLSFLCISREGKSDLDHNISGILRNWRVPGDRFVILRDNDGGDCYELKERLRGLCRRGGREDTLIRIVCQELEGWYLGEPDALADAFGGRQATYRNPDARPKPSSDLTKLNPSFEKSSGARRMAERMTRERNRSHSFAVFLSGVERLLADNA